MLVELLLVVAYYMLSFKRIAIRMTRPVLKLKHSVLLVTYNE